MGALPMRHFLFDFTRFFADKNATLANIRITTIDIEPSEYHNPKVNAAAATMITHLQKLDTVKAAIRHTLAKREPLLEVETKGEHNQAVVRDINTADAVKELNKKYPGHVAMINMANRQSVGGDAFNGAYAQEERLFVTTDIAGSLLSYAQQTGGSQVFDRNNLTRPHFHENAFNPTDILYSSNKILRNVDDKIQFTDLKSEDQTPVNIITTAAIRYSPEEKRYYEKYYRNNKNVVVVYTEEEAEKILYATIYNQIHTILINGNKAAVLSAFGCGAFQNHPQVIANIYRNVLSLPEFYGKLETQFAIFKNPKLKNYEVFAEVFKAPLVKLDTTITKKIHSYVESGPTIQGRYKEAAPLTKPIDSSFFRDSNTRLDTSLKPRSHHGSSNTTIRKKQ